MASASEKLNFTPETVHFCRIGGAFLRADALPWDIAIDFTMRFVLKYKRYKVTFNENTANYVKPITTRKDAS